MGNPSSKVVIVGFDGMDYRYLDQFPTPTIDDFRAKGVDAALHSTHPPWTGSAWPSMYTGCEPSHHGVYDFYRYSDAYPPESTSVSRRDVRAPALWDYLNSRGINSVVLNVPITHPAEAFNGTLVPGYLAPEDAPGHPDGIRDELSDAIGEPYSIYSSEDEESSTDETVAGYVDLIEMRTKAIQYLLTNREWEFAFVQIQKTDTVFHSSSNETHFKQVYAAADNALETVLDSCGDETNVIICSDHGIGPIDGYLVFLNEILRDNGYVETVSDTSKSKTRTERPEDSPSEPSFSSRALLTATRGLSAVGLTPARIYAVAQRAGLEGILKSNIPDEVQARASESVSWEASMAFCRRQSEQGIRINLEGRDPEGIVPREEYNAVRDDIIALLSDLETPTGEPVFEFVVPREKFYDGPYADEACDILFRTNDMNHKVSADVYGRRMVPKQSYDHKPTGVFMASGPAFKDAHGPTELSITDIAPTVLTAMGYPVPERMTGKAPEGLLVEEASTGKYDIEYAPTEDYTQDQDEVKERLSDLGYL